MIDDYEKQIECVYKGETYSVRDNGAVMRHARAGQKVRPIDNIWTFGNYNQNTGYAEISGERVHRIVATAFYGEPPSPQYVVDHIDTNRKNNRPENLRWITKLENILLNPITVKRIILSCGSVEEFLKDPSKLQSRYIDKGYEWMRAVTKEEAAACLERMLNWAKSDTPLRGGTLGEWIYTRSKNINSNDSVEKTPENLSQSSQPDQKAASQKISKNNPFGFPRPGENDMDENLIMYRTEKKIFELIRSLIEVKKTIMLPDIVLPTAGKGITIKESEVAQCEEINCYYVEEGRRRSLKSILFNNEHDLTALIIRMKSVSDEEEIDRLKKAGYNIVELDMSWAKRGVTEDEMDYILQTDITKKKWLYHGLIRDAEEKLQKISEPIDCAGRGIFHSYYACPIGGNIGDLDCMYCHYRMAGMNGMCFGKSGVKTYQDLLSIENVEKEEEKIVSISYYKKGKHHTKRFSKNVELPGKTLFELWEKKDGNKLIAYNIYSEWYVLLEEDPKISFEKTGKVYAKISRALEGLETRQIREIDSSDNYCWKMIA